MIRGGRIIIAVATMTGEGESYTHMHTQAHERNQWPPVILYSVMHNYTLSYMPGAQDSILELTLE